jgi:acyl carrier protein
MENLNPHTKEIRDFVVNNFLFGEAGSLADDTSFLEEGVLDSTGILELVTFLESQYSIKVQDQEMVPENLDSINRAAAFVGRKQAEKASAAA